MMPGVFPLATEPVARAPGPAPLPANFVAAIEGPAAEGQYLIEVSLYKGGEPRSGGLATVAEEPLAVVPGGVGVTVGQVVLTYSDRHWVGSPTDADKPNAFYEGRVTAPLTINRAMPLLPEEPRRTRRQFGDIVFANGDGALDPIVQSYAPDGRQVRVLFGPVMGAYQDFRAIAEVLGTEWSGTESEVRLGVRDQGFGLDTPVQQNLYLGTGGAEGPAELEGKPKPLTFGRCRNVTAVLIDAANLIYQVHDGAISALDDVFDQGLALTDGANDVADYTALVAESVTAGQYETAKAEGLFKLGALPNGLVTADVRGDATPDYADTLDPICLRVLKDRHGLSHQWIDQASFAGAAVIAGEMGAHIGIDQVPSTAQVITALIGATAGWWGAGRDGRIRAGRLTAPEDRSPNLYLRSEDILDLRPEPTPVPRWRQRVGFKPNWTVQRGEDLAASVTAARRQFLAAPLSVVQSADATIKARHLRALDPDPLPGLYENAADADTLAAFLLALHTPDRQVFSCTVARKGYLLDLQKVVRIVSYPRFWLQNGKNFTVIGLEERAGPRGEIVTLRLWG